MACSCAPALIKLRNQLNEAYPERDKRSDGCCASSGHTSQNPTSDHEPRGSGAAKGYAIAYDVDEDLQPGHDLGPSPLLGFAAAWLADERTRYAIYEARIYYAQCRTHGADCFKAGGHPYTGKNAHGSHLHVSLWVQWFRDLRPWALPPLNSPTPAPDTTQEDDDVARLVKFKGKNPEGETPPSTALFLLAGRVLSRIKDEHEFWDHVVDKNMRMRPKLDKGKPTGEEEADLLVLDFDSKDAATRSRAIRHAAFPQL